MNKLLNEFLSYIQEVDRKKREAGTSWVVNGNWYAKNAAGERASFGSGESAKAAAERFAKGQSLEKKPKDTKKGNTRTKKSIDNRTDKSQAVVTPTSNFVKTSIETIPGGEGTWSAVTGQLKVPRIAGAGTPQSKAAEASVVIVSNSLIQNKPTGMSMTDYLNTPDAQAIIDEMITDLQQVKGSKLTDSWVPTVQAQVKMMLSSTEEVYGEIESIVWDNEGGRKQFGLGPKTQQDRSDAYIRLKDGKIIGTSLKKSGKVFLANLGYSTSMTRMAKFTDNKVAKEVFSQLSTEHSRSTTEVVTSILDELRQSTDLQNSIKEFNRTGKDDFYASSKYDEYFNEDGSINEKLISELLSDEVVTTSTPRTKILLRILGEMQHDGTLRLRDVDRRSTLKFLKEINENTDVRMATTKFLVDQLDIPQMLSAKPFGEESPVSAISIVYGEGATTEGGQRPPLFVHGQTIRKILNIPDNMSDGEARDVAEASFLLDTDSGVASLRVKNTDPPPESFYPMIATVGLRSRGLGQAATMECLQHDAWTTILTAGSINPAEWTDRQRKDHAESAIRFLSVQEQNEALSDEQKKKIREDLYFYKNIYEKN